MKVVAAVRSVNRQKRGGLSTLSLWLVTIFVLTACNSAKSPAPVDNTVSQTEISSDGGQAQSGDKNLTLDIPANALPAGATISIEKISADDLGSHFEGIEVQAAYRLGPAGTQFAEPVKLTLKLDSVTVDAARVTANMPAVLLESNGELSGLENVEYRLNADTGEVTLLADVPHFSTLVVSRNRKDGVTLSTIYLEGFPESVYAYEPFVFRAGSVEAKAQFTRVSHAFSGSLVVVDDSSGRLTPNEDPGQFLPLPGHFTKKPLEAFAPLLKMICVPIARDIANAIYFEAYQRFDIAMATDPVIFKILNAMTKSSGTETNDNMLHISKSFTCKPARDTDGDGLNNKYEYILDTDRNNPDSDGNGTDDGNEDQDGDGLSNLQEQTLGTNPTRMDSDENGINDGDEDWDGDGLTTLQELAAGTDPNVADSDGGGVNDGKEMLVDKTDPLDPFDDGKVVRLCPETIGVGETIPTGLKSLPTGRNRLEQLRLIIDARKLRAGSISTACAHEAPAVKTTSDATPGFTDAVPAGTVAVTVATDGKWDVVNLLNNSAISFPHFHEMVYYQAVLMMVESAIAPYNAALLAVGIKQPGIFGFNGGVDVFNRAGNSASSLLEFDAYDAQTVGGGFVADQAVIAFNDRVSQFTLLNEPIGTQGDMLNAMTPLFLLSDVDPDAGATRILGAYRQMATGPVLTLTDGRQIAQELYIVNPTTKAFHKFAGTGLQQNKIVNPRQLRCLDSVCVVSHFGGVRDDGTTDPGGVTVLSWNGTEDMNGSIIATVPMGSESAPSGIVGVSLIGDGRGNVAIAAAGYSSGEIYELVVENGVVTRSVSQAVPAGCSNPGHVQYLTDAEGLKLIASCYSTSNYVVAKSKLQ